jgi:hypothetical protein
LTREEFQRIGIRMYGVKHWRREYSVNLGINHSTVWRISKREQDIPPVVEVAVRGLLDKYRARSRATRELRELRRRERKRPKLGAPKGKRKKEKVHAALEVADTDPGDEHAG